MTTTNRIVLFFLLPMIAPLLYPPSTLANALPIVILDVILFVILGIFLMRGSSKTLTLSIFIQGLNVITRLMMFFPHAAFPNGAWDVAYIVTSLVAMALSMYLLLRFDQVDVRATMVT